MIGLGAWFFISRKSINTKDKAIKIISDFTGIGEASYQSMGESYLISRAKAIKSGSDTFEDASATYTTKSGRLV